MESQTACAINIGPKERRKRLLVGLGLLVLGIAIAALMFALETGRPQRVVAFFPFWMGFQAVLQARAKT